MNMAASYSRLWKLFVDKNMSKTQVVGVAAND